MRTLFAISLLLSLALLSPVVAQAAIIKGPYLQKLDKNSITIMWETSASSQSEVDYGPTGSLGSVATGAAGTVHEVNIASLTENSTYYYKAVSGADSSAVYTFKTASSLATSFRFVALGDSRSNPTMVKTLSTLVGSLNPKPVLALHTGDIVSDGTVTSRWGTEFFTPQQPMMATLPVYTALGNHEYNSPNYFSLFSLPGGERWYSVDGLMVRPLRYVLTSSRFWSATM